MGNNSICSCFDSNVEENSESDILQRKNIRPQKGEKYSSPTSNQDLLTSQDRDNRNAFS
jgi:hypothetical protein